MFFTQALLERRESGYGLMWLAATLGPKSSFRKLPKRSVLGADISELCTLIAEPAEPLALRLSSNLMIGVTRVYKVKQEIFMTDVTTCFNALKKAVQDMNVLSATAAQLQMGQPTLRADALTVVADPGNAFGMDLDNTFMGWPEIVKEPQDFDMFEGSDEEFDPKAKKSKPKKGKQKDAPSSAVSENARARHTLAEHHDFLLSGSLEADPIREGSAGAGGFDPSSSQYGGFGFEDNVFGLPDDAIGGDIGDELARELGEGWGGSPSILRPIQPGGRQGDAMFDVDMNIGLGEDFAFDTPYVGPFSAPEPEMLSQRGSPAGASAVAPLQLGQGAHGTVSGPVGEGNAEDVSTGPVQRSAKRVRLKMDARTELTDDELKLARANYVQQQVDLKRDILQKKAEKENTKVIEEMIWGVPKGVEAPVLVDFWMENFRLQVEAHSGELRLQMEGEPPKKRRRTVTAADVFGGKDASSPARDFDFGMVPEQPADFAMDDLGGLADFQDTHNGYPLDLDSRMRSSEEPGQARRASRPPSALGINYEYSARPVQDAISASQRSSLFPWDHAGPSSSAGGAAYDLDGFGSDVFSAARGVSARGRSIGSRRESPAMHASAQLGISAELGLRHSGVNEDFQFDVPAEQEETQESDIAILTLEKNSYNFLEYAKMQLQAFPSATHEVSFDDIVPKATSTPRVAAAAFYHCLVLATKDLVSVSQAAPYDVLKIKVK